MRSILGGLAWTLVGVLAFGCTKRPVIHTFEPPPVGAAYSRRDVEVHHQLSEALIECQHELDARWEADRGETRKRRVLMALYAILYTILAGGRGTEGYVFRERPCDRSRYLEDECTPQWLPQLHVGPTWGPNGTLEDTPRAGLDLRADIDAALARLDELLEAPELEVDRDEVLAAIAQLRTECHPSPSPLSADPPPATLAP